MYQEERSKWRIIIMVAVVVYIALTGYIFARNYKNIVVAVRRKDLMEAVRKVDDQEKLVIEKQIKKTQSESVKQILTPLVLRGH